MKEDAREGRGIRKQLTLEHDLATAEEGASVNQHASGLIRKQLPAMSGQSRKESDPDGRSVEHRHSRQQRFNFCREGLAASE